MMLDHFLGPWTKERVHHTSTLRYTGRVSTALGRSAESDKRLSG